MPWAIASFVMGAGSAIMQGQHAKEMAAKQRALAEKQSKVLRAQAARTRAALGREIDSMRMARAMDMPAFQQAAQTSFIQAKKGAERMARHRMMGRLAPEVRDAIFGGQFQQYVGREMQKLRQHTELTGQIFKMTAEQQQQVNALESQAVQLGYGGEAQAIGMEAAAGDPMANLLGVAAQSSAQYGEALSAKATAQAGKETGFYQQALFSDIKPEDILARRTTFSAGAKGAGIDVGETGLTAQQFYEFMMGLNR